MDLFTHLGGCLDIYDLSRCIFNIVSCVPFIISQPGIYKIIAPIIRLRAQFLDYPIMTIRLDNAGEFTSQAFDDYCLSIGIIFKHPLAYVHLKMALLSHLSSVYN